MITARNLPPWPMNPLAQAIASAIYGPGNARERLAYRLVERAVAVINEEERKAQAERRK